MIRAVILSCAMAAAFAAAPGSARAAPQFCTFEYRPVCASERGRPPTTFGNACQARAKGARILSAGECRRACTRIYRPVCAKAQGRPRATFPNACVARQSGARVIHEGGCRR